MMIVFKKINEFIDNKEKNEYHQLIDYTKLSDNLSNDNIKELCKEAENNNFYSVCVLPEFIATAYSFLDNTKLCALIDFPKGDNDVKNKIEQIDDSIVNGADEVDVVINYKLIKDTNSHDELKDEIRQISEYCHREGVIAKIIIEVGALNYQELETICRMCIDGNVDYIMISTGKLPNDDSFEKKLEKVKYMRKILPNETYIKFSGGVRTLEQIKELKPYVNRIGTSAIPQ